MSAKDRFTDFGGTQVPLAQLLEEAAARYTKVKWLVLPLTKEKEPTTGQTPHGHKDASLNYKKFSWERPCVAIAVATGQSKLIVVDTDSKEAHDKLFREHDPQCGLYQVTPSGNRQYFYLDPEGTYKSRNGWRTDVDIKAVGGYVAVPHGVKGKRQRTWHGKFSDLGSPPAWLVALLPKVSDKTPPPPGGDRAALPILERHGGTYVGEVDGNLRYRRPGKDSGYSATWNGHVFYVFSSHWPPFEADFGYSYQKIYELLEGPKSAWRERQLAAAWEDKDYEALFDLLGGACAAWQHQYRDKWRGSSRRVGEYDDRLKEAKGEFQVNMDSMEQQGQLLQKDYPALFEELKHTVQLNECNLDLEIDGVPWGDNNHQCLLYDAREWAQERGRSVLEGFMVSALYHTAEEHKYNPLKDYLEGLDVWDGAGTPEIDKIITCHETEEDHAVGVAACIKAWLVGVVAGVYESDYQNPMIVTQGAQGMGKSHVPKWLCSDLKAYFLARPVVVDKDDQLLQSRTWIWEVEELEGTTSKAQIAALKAFITRDVTRLRVPFGKREMPRKCIANYFGTLNPDEFLFDTTGNRRFLVCPLIGLDWSYSGKGLGPWANKDAYRPELATTAGQVWAEALALYRRGLEEGVEVWQLSREQKAEAEAIATQALVTSDVDALLWEVVELTDKDEDIVWLDDVVRGMREAKVRVSSDDRLRKSICNAFKKEECTTGRRARGKLEGGQGGKNKKRWFGGARLKGPWLTFGEEGGFKRGD